MRVRKALGAALAILFCGLAPTLAIGQPKLAPSAQPKADKPPQKGDKSAPTAAPTGSAAAGDALPPGHPHVGGDGLPAGHPAVDDDDDDAPAPRGGNPRGGIENRIFRPPPDGAQEDPTLPAGTLIAIIKDADNKPIPRATITLDILHSTVAKGDTTEKIVRETGEDGSIRFDNLGFGSGIRYRVSTVNGPATYALGSITLNDKVGKRVTVHSYAVASNIDDVGVLTQADVYITLREDSLQIEESISMLNIGKVAWAPAVRLTLPAEYKAFNKQEAPDSLRADDADGVVTLRGTVPPGQHGVSFHYQVTLKGEATQSIRLELPPNVVQVRIIAEASKTMSLAVPGFNPAQRTDTREGKKVLVTGWRAGSAEEKAPSTIELNLGGLPTNGPGRWIAVGLALVALAAGIAYLAQKPEGLDADARSDLIEAREALLGELVALERAQKAGEIGPKTYARVRASLVDALARIVAMLDEARAAQVAKKPQRRRDGRAAETSS